MKRISYMSANELLDFLKIGTFCGEAEAIANRTPEKDWARKLRCVSSYCKKITQERLAVLDKKQLDSVDRRNRHSTLVLYTSDQRRVAKDSGKPEEEVVVGTDDLFIIVDQALLSCTNCTGDWVKGCRLREVLHRIDVPPICCDPHDGLCEYCHRGGMDINERFEKMVLEGKIADRI